MSNQYGFDFLKVEHVVVGESNADVSTTQNNSNNYSVPITDADDNIGPTTTYETNLQKQFVVLQFLRSHRSSGCLPPSVIKSNIGVDLSEGGADEEVSKLLLNNAKVRVEQIPDPEDPASTMFTFGYQSKFMGIRNKVGLLAQINRCKNGVRRGDLMDAYDGVVGDLASLLTAGDVLGVTNGEGKDAEIILFPRGDPFLVELDGHVTLSSLPPNRYQHQHQHQLTNPHQTHQNLSSHQIPNVNVNLNKNPYSNLIQNPNRKHNPNLNQRNPSLNPTGNSIFNHNSNANMNQQFGKNDGKEKDKTPSPPPADPSAPTFHSMLKISSDPRTQVRRGEAISICGQWFRISSAVIRGVPNENQPARAQPPPTVAMMKDLSTKNLGEYVKPFDSSTLSLDASINNGTASTIENAVIGRARLRSAMSAMGGAGGIGGGGMRGGGGGMRGGGGGALGGGGVAERAASSILSQEASAPNPSTLAAELAKCTPKSVAGAMGGKVRGRPIGASALAAALQYKADAAAAVKTAALNPTILGPARARRHGCTVDVRKMYLATATELPSKAEEDVRDLMVKHGLLDENEEWRQTRTKRNTERKVGEDGRLKKRRYYTKRGQQFTNKHLSGDIRATLERALERQEQGKVVGDGGM